MKQISVGIIGTGFIAELHMHAYRRVFGLDARVRAVVSRGDRVVEFAKRFGIPQTYRDYRELLADKNIDVIDICTPPARAQASM
jgi:predicted dehydrogenase